MKKLTRILILAMVLMLALAPAVSLAELTQAQKNAENSVVRIRLAGTGKTMRATVESVESGNASFEDYETFTWTGWGSGICLGKKGQNVEYVLTNRHVAERNYDVYTNDEYYYIDEYITTTMDIITDNVATPIGAKLVASGTADIKEYNDETLEDDYAVIKLDMTIPNSVRQPVVFRNFKDDPTVVKGENVAALGFPASLYKYVDKDNNSNTSGDLSLINTTVGTVVNVLLADVSKNGVEEILHSATISGGNSGGALVDKNGYLIGMNTWEYSEMENTYSAISVNTIRTFLDNNHLEYEIEPGVNILLIVLIAVAAVLLIAIVVLLILKNRKKTSPKPAPADKGETRLLCCVSGTLAGKSWKLHLHGETYAVGRNPQGKYLIVYPAQEPGISQNHCEIHFGGEGVKVTDHSSNGTFIDGKAIGKEKTAILHRGQTLTLGSPEKKHAFILKSN